MPLVALAPATRESRLAAAALHWTALLEARPDLAPAVALQRRLIGLVVDLADVVERGRLPKLSLPPRYLAAQLARGVPALAGEPIPLPVTALTPTLLILCGELSRGGAGEAGDHIHAALLETRMDAGSLLAASLARDQKVIRASAAHLGLAADLLWLVAELTVSPFAHLLQQTWLSAAAGEATLAAALARWTHGYCPACGSWPALAEVAGGRRVLRCSFCALAWDVPPSICVYCGRGGESFTTLTPGTDLSRHVEMCSACTGYLKEVDAEELLPFPLVAIADMATMGLDMVALERGGSRPSLKELLPRR